MKDFLKLLDSKVKYNYLSEDKKDVKFEIKDEWNDDYFT
jgi:hypothetical protein